MYHHQVTASTCSLIGLLVLLCVGASSTARGETAMGLSADGVVDLNPPRITLISPAAGDVLLPGQVYQLIWSIEEELFASSDSIIICEVRVGSEQEVYELLPASPDGHYSLEWTAPDPGSQFCFWRVEASDSLLNHDSSQAGPFAISESGVGAEQTPLPAAALLAPNFPNPFNPVTELRFALPVESRLRLAIYDVRGRLVEVLVDGRLSAGWHSVEWSAAGRPSAVYLARLETGERVLKRKLLLLK